MPLSPISFNVNIRPNREIITPLEFGDIIYEYPTELTTNAISEIVVLNAPLNSTRFGALFGKPSDVGLTQRFSTDATSSNAFDFVPEQDLTASLTLPAVGYINSGNDSIFTDPNAVNDKLLTRKSNNELLNGSSSIYYPQVDFYPRYNQWFASSSWPVPFLDAVYPQQYDVLFVYADRPSKTIYYRYGLAQLNVISSESIDTTNSSLTQLSVSSASLSATSFTLPGGLVRRDFAASVEFDAVLSAGTYQFTWTIYQGSNVYTETSARTYDASGSLTLSHTFSRVMSSPDGLIAILDIEEIERKHRAPRTYITIVAT